MRPNYGSKLASESKLTQVNEYVENLESDPEIFEQSTQNHTYPLGDETVPTESEMLSLFLRTFTLAV